MGHPSELEYYTPELDLFRINRSKAKAHALEFELARNGYERGEEDGLNKSRYRSVARYME